MKHEIEISEDICSEEFGESLMYCVQMTSFAPYKDRDNYLRHREEVDVIKAFSIEELYELMAHYTVAHMMVGEIAYAKDNWESPKDQFYVEFSNIFVEVEHYDEDRMKATKTYQEIGVAREKKRLEEEQKAAAEAERSRLWNMVEKERRDKQEWERLQKKFGNK